jgi:hypothetical protein
MQYERGEVEDRGQKRQRGVLRNLLIIVILHLRWHSHREVASALASCKSGTLGGEHMEAMVYVSIPSWRLH